MSDTNISAFVDRLESGQAKVDDFRALTVMDWEEVKLLLEARRQFHMHRYVNALLMLRVKTDYEQLAQKRTYSESEILAELEISK